MSAPTTPPLELSKGTRLLVKGLVGCAGLIVLLGLSLFYLVKPRLESRIADQRADMLQDFAEIESALEQWRASHGGAYPETLNVLFVPDERGKSLLPSQSPPRDPWGQGYLYRAPTSPGAKPLLYTLGRDRTEGGDGENVDFANQALPHSPR